MKYKIKNTTIFVFVFTLFSIIILFTINGLRSERNNVAFHKKTSIDTVSSREKRGLYIYEKEGVNVGEYVLDIVYKEHKTPVLCENMRPLTGDLPQWMEMRKNLREYYKYDYDTLRDSCTLEYAEYVGLTEEALKIWKEKYLKGNDDYPELTRQSVLSEIFVNHNDREYLMVEMDDYGWQDSITNKLSHGVSVVCFEKVDGKWKLQVPSALSWRKEIPSSRKEIRGLLDGE